jgi:hypothetical protein
MNCPLLVNPKKKIVFFFGSEHYREGDSLDRQAIQAIVHGTGTKQWNVCVVLEVSF